MNCPHSCCLPKPPPDRGLCRHRHRRIGSQCLRRSYGFCPNPCGNGLKTPSFLKKQPAGRSCGIADVAILLPVAVYISNGNIRPRCRKPGQQTLAVKILDIVFFVGKCGHELSLKIVLAVLPGAILPGLASEILTFMRWLGFTFCSDTIFSPPRELNLYQVGLGRRSEAYVDQRFNR